MNSRSYGVSFSPENVKSFLFLVQMQLRVKPHLRNDISGFRKTNVREKVEASPALAQVLDADKMTQSSIWAFWSFPEKSM